MNIHDRWMHKDGNDEICVKCGDIQSIDTLYNNYHASVPDTVCSSAVVWTHAYEKNQDYTKMPFWCETKIAAEEGVVCVQIDSHTTSQKAPAT